ncbi:hypothetical protein O1611_g6437 [Lasiodiplodia mahajangana]|uniref:Uncharacterized protein n=1 Tax=Lasiodiplodia mahajangana TaxID=1108764 RepID=A0ACC2JIJ9_9PEZI|nr:hypothetical protein O1611_g6437 [Lasiodiplodia mahajangana]
MEGLKHVSASGPNPESIPSHRQEAITTVSATGDQNQGHMEIRHRPSSNFRSDSSWLRTNKQHGDNMAMPEISAPIKRDHSRKGKEQFDKVQSQLTPVAKVNPFILNDKKGKGQEAEKSLTIRSMSRMECEDPMCRATHTGHYPFRHSVSCSKHGSEHSRRALDLSSTSNRPPPVGVFQGPHSDTNLPSGHLHDVHRHHSASFHSNDHIAEHLSSAVGHNVYHLLKGPNPPDHQQHITASERTIRDATDTMSGEAPIHGEQREIQSESNPSRRDNIPPRLRLVSTPSWLRNPTKGSADAIAPLHHIDTKNHEIHDHDHGYLSNIAIHPHDDHSRGHGPSRSSHKIGTREGRHLPSKMFPNAYELISEAPHATPKIRIDPASPKRRQRNAPASVSKRREIFEPTQEHASIASPAKDEAKDTHLHSDTRAGEEENSNPKPLLHTPLRPQVSSKAFTPTPNQSNQELEHDKGKTLVEQSPELEIAKPMPIAPPNHDCAWKERYLALTAKIRQLKAEMSTRASLRSSEFLTPGHEEHDDDHDLLGVTVNLHFRDRDDIVIGADVA